MMDYTPVVYDLDALRRGLRSIDTNIASIEQALAAERVKKAEYEKHIAAAEVVVAMHRRGGRP